MTARRPSVILVFASSFALAATGAAALAVSTAQSAGTQARVFELRTYTTAEGKLGNLHNRFRDHTMKLFERHGMVNIAYWTPQEPSLAGNTLIYVLAHKDRQAAQKSWAAFQADPEWQAVKAASEANGAIVTKVESVFMDSTDYSALK